MTQISLFDGDTPLKITKPIRLIELFAGYGSQSLALKYLKVPFEHWKICEWAVKSIQAYKDLHFGDDTCDYSKAYSVDELIEVLLAKGISADYNAPMTREQIKRMGEQKIRTVYNNIIATNNLVSVCNAHAQDFEIQDTDNYTYIMTYSFPCQDLSKAGNGAGMAKGSGTRSGMLWEVERILDECNGNLPQILLMENVPDVIGANNIKHFAQWIKKLEQLGYTSKWQCLNAKDYGVPQNRDRCFMVSWLGNHYYDFPTPIKLEKRLKDVLETNVDEKYYLSSDIIKYFEKHTQESIEKGKWAIPHLGNGKVVGEFVCDKVDKIIPLRHTYYNYIGLPIANVIEYGIWNDDFAQMCLKKKEIDNYGKGKMLYGWHISDLKIYDKPKELSEFKVLCNVKTDCHNCPYYNYNKMDCDSRVITRAPQSWQYVEEL